MEHLFGNNKQQVVTHGNPNLCVNSVAGCSVEGLDVKVPFNELEERLHIPSLAIEFRDGQGGQAEVVGDERIDIVRCIVLINDQSYPLWVIGGCLWTCKHDVLVAEQAGVLVNPPLVNHLVFRVGLSSRDKERMLPVKQRVEPLEVDIPFVYQVVSEGFDRQLVHDFAVMHTTFGQVDESGDAAPEVEQRVQLDRALTVMELRPWAKFQTQFDGAAVKGIDHLVDAETVVVLVVELSRLLDEILSEVVVNAPILFLVHLTESGTRNEGQSGVIQFALKGGQRSLVGPQTMLGGQLGKAHDHELVAATELDHVPVAIIPCDALAERVFRKKGHELGEYALTFIHLICTLCYYQTQSYNFKSSKKYFPVIHYKKII